MRRNLARVLSNRGTSPANLKRREEALSAYDEATVIRQEPVAEEQREVHRDLADVLHQRGFSLIKLNRHDEALPANGEAIAIERELAAEEKQADEGNEAHVRRR